AGRFRANAARALLLPRRRPGTRTPLWQQRQRAADLLAVASKHGSFPILLETYRECLRDAFDVPALIELMTHVRSRQLRVVSVDTGRPSPFATSLAFAYVANFLYEGDAPLAERKAQALTLDRELLAELLGAEELRELIQPSALAELEAFLQCLDERRWARRVGRAAGPEPRQAPGGDGRGPRATGRAPAGGRGGGGARARAAPAAPRVCGARAGRAGGGGGGGGARDAHPPKPGRTQRKEN